MARSTKGQFLPGNGGRPVGARNKLHGDLIAAYQKAFDDNSRAFEILAKDSPKEFLKLGVALCPREHFVESDKGTGLSEEELTEALEFVRQRKAAQQPTKGH